VIEEIEEFPPIDFADFENVAGALAQPAGSVSVISRTRLVGSSTEMALPSSL